MFEAHIPSSGAGGSHLVPLNNNLLEKSVGFSHLKITHTPSSCPGMCIVRAIVSGRKLFRTAATPSSKKSKRNARLASSLVYNGPASYSYTGVAWSVWRRVASLNVQAHDYHSRHASSDSGFLIYNWIYRFPIDSIQFYREPYSLLQNTMARPDYYWNKAITNKANNVRIT